MPSPLARYRSLLRPLRGWVVVHALSVAAVGGMKVLPPLLAGALVDLLLADAHAWWQTLPVLVPAAVVLGIAQVGIGYASGALSAMVSETVTDEARRGLYRHFARLDADYFHRHPLGDLTSRATTDVERGVGPIYASVVDILYGSSSLLAAVVALALLDLRLLAIFAVVLVINVVLFTVFQPRVQRIFRRLQDANGRLAARLTEALNAHALVRAFAREERVADAIRRRSDELARRQYSAERFMWRFLVGVWAFGVFLGPLGILLAGAALVPHGLAVGAIVTAYLCWKQASEHLWDVIGGGTGLVQSRAALARSFAVFDAAPAVTDAEQAPDLRITGGAISLRGAEFRYPTRGREFQLGPLDLDIAGGSRLALVGPSGCGKTSLIHLLTRTYDPQAGSVRIDGTDLRAVGQDSVRRAIGVVQQETQLFAGSIADNLRFVRPDATDDQVRGALRDAGMGETLAAWPDGIATTIGERGVQLSGGQRQRLSLARVLLADPPLVVLDEATSALDAATEAAVWRMLETRLAGRTVLVVTHRLATAVRAGRVAVLERGRLLACGTPDAVRRDCALFREMCAHQGFGDGKDAP